MKALPILAMLAGVGGCAEHAVEPAPVPVAKADSCRTLTGPKVFVWGALGAGVGGGLILLLERAID